MKKLKKILQYNCPYYILLIISILITVYKINTPVISIYNENMKEVKGIVTDYIIKDNKTTIYLKGRENILITYPKEINISYGDYIKVNGLFYEPDNNTNFNLFNYKKYLLSRKINYIVKADRIRIISNNKLYILKNILIKRINKCNKTKGYIKAFLFSDKNYIDMNLYKKLGISHLFSVSGMHVSLISLLLLRLLSFMNNKKYILISIILIIYMYLTNFTISMVRACFQFILFSLNKIVKLKIKNINIIIFIFSIVLIYNPYYIYNIGFIFTFIISFTLVKYNETNPLKISLISILSSLPILINNFYQVNFLSIIYNIFYIPYVTFILFPLSLLTILFPFLDKINYIFINIFENISNILSNINILTINIAKIPVVLIIIYYIVLYIYLSKKRIKELLLLFLLIIVFIFYKLLVFTSSVTYINVGQGDSNLIRIKNKNILIDTGGNINIDIINNILLPYLRSEGVKKIDYLILTHGDFDHMGEAINLVKEFKIEKVIFNCGEFNDLESELIKVLDKKKIPYYSCIKELNIDDNKLYFLQTKLHDNENDNSNVIYTKINDYKFMFMGDAGINKEKDILDKYNISDIDVLKVGHHGSKTSSSIEFIDEMNPKYSIISVGKNNRYAHPNKEVLNNLYNSKIYRTDEDGSIMFKIKNNKLQIETCSP